MIKFTAPQMSHMNCGQMGFIVLLSCLSILMSGCGKDDKLKENPFRSPPPVFTGPVHYKGAVRSVANLRKNKPTLVSGYGMVVGLDGSGSGDVPSHMRPRLLDELRKRGLGLRKYNASSLTPARFLDSNDTALVIVQGVIPPGAIKGSRFDIMVSAHPSTETTSLKGGRLWTTDLGIGGANRNMAAVTTRARGMGNIYINPMLAESIKLKKQEGLVNRQAFILGGGIVTEGRILWLSLNMPSWKWSGAIADLINERFLAGPGELKTANAKNDTGIEIRVPKRYGHEINHFLGLILHLYLDRSHQFVRNKAVELTYHLEKNSSEQTSVKLAWEAMGNKVLPVIRKLYDEQIEITITPDVSQQSDNKKIEVKKKTNLVHVRQAALEVGARLGDVMVIPNLVTLAESPSRSSRFLAARCLAFFPDHFRAMRTLRELMKDEEDAVRIAAYEGLSLQDESTIVSRLIGDEEESKFMMDLVNMPDSKPLVYVNQHPISRMPRITIFNRDTTFKFPILSRHLKNRLTILGESPTSPMQVLYQAKDRIASSPWRDIYKLDRRYQDLNSKEEEFHGRLIDFFNKNENRALIMSQLADKNRKLDMSLPKIQDLTDRFFYSLKSRPLLTYSRRKPQLEDLYDTIVFIRGKRALAKVAGEWQEVILPSVVRPSIGEEMIPPTIADYVLLLGNRKTYLNRFPGFDRTFSEVTETLYQMDQSKNLDADFKVASNSLAGVIKQLEEQEKRLTGGERKDSDIKQKEEAKDDVETGEILPGFPTQRPALKKEEEVPKSAKPMTEPQQGSALLKGSPTKMKGGR